MQSDSQDPPIDALFNLLSEERNALIKGDFDALKDMSPQKARLIEQIGSHPESRQDQLSALQDRIARNQTLLNSALDGIRAVRDRINDLQEVRQGLETYDKSGLKFRVTTSRNSKLEKRA